uniref:Putative secreted protein n=1 Tax=Anopheles darlingi TaxID=43151 RepID=A0A2M4D569_ANODA
MLYWFVIIQLSSSRGFTVIASSPLASAPPRSLLHCLSIYCYCVSRPFTRLLPMPEASNRYRKVVCKSYLFM